MKKRLCALALAWAVRHFGNADLGDRRLSKDWSKPQP
jgi:hypothetical protein